MKASLLIIFVTVKVSYTQTVGFRATLVTSKMVEKKEKGLNTIIQVGNFMRENGKRIVGVALELGTI